VKFVAEGEFFLTGSADKVSTVQFGGLKTSYYLLLLCPSPSLVNSHRNLPIISCLCSNIPLVCPKVFFDLSVVAMNYRT